MLTETKFLKVLFDLHCDWEGFPPEYRLYVNDELFTERTYDFSSDTFVREMLQIEASPGEYEIRLEKLGPQVSEFTISNTHIKLGPGEVIDERKFRIL
jgi:hypothetical protein